jgi:hypothetical protein
MARALPLVALGLAATLGGCGAGASPASGLSAYLRATATGAQFVPGELGTEPGAMTPTVQINSSNTHVFPGAQGRTLTGTASGDATAVLIGLQGDSGHWLIPVGGVPDLSSGIEGALAVTASLSYSPELPTGERLLVGRAVALDGTVGPAKTLALKIDSSVPTAALVVSLAWDTPADLDLHVHVTPDDGSKPFDVWQGAPTALAPGAHTDAEWAAAGHLVLDSDARCVSDGRRLEQLVFDKAAPPAGTYDVRVDTFSLCGEATARWSVSASTNPAGTPDTFLAAFGQSIDRDTVADHNALSGLYALTFHWPR